MITKTELDKLVEKYETVDFIKDDPIQFCHRYNQKEEIELAGFISSLFIQRLSSNVYPSSQERILSFVLLKLQRILLIKELLLILKVTKLLKLLQAKTERATQE